MDETPEEQVIVLAETTRRTRLLGLIMLVGGGLSWLATARETAGGAFLACGSPWLFAVPGLMLTMAADALRAATQTGGVDEAKTLVALDRVGRAFLVRSIAGGLFALMILMLTGIVGFFGAIAG